MASLEALVDAGAFVSAIPQTVLDRLKQEATINIFKINDPPNFLTQVTNGQLEKSLATTTLKTECGHDVFAEFSIF